MKSSIGPLYKESPGEEEPKSICCEGRRQSSKIRKETRKKVQITNLFSEEGRRSRRKKVRTFVKVVGSKRKDVSLLVLFNQQTENGTCLGSECPEVKLTKLSRLRMYNFFLTRGPLVVPPVLFLSLSSLPLLLPSSLHYSRLI